MPGAENIQLDEHAQEQLQSLARSRTCTVSRAERARGLVFEFSSPLGGVVCGRTVSTPGAYTDPAQPALRARPPCDQNAQLQTPWNDHSVRGTECRQWQGYLYVP